MEPIYFIINILEHFNDSIWMNSSKDDYFEMKRRAVSKDWFDSL